MSGSRATSPFAEADVERFLVVLEDAWASRSGANRI